MANRVGTENLEFMRSDLSDFAGQDQVTIASRHDTIRAGEDYVQSDDANILHRTFDVAIEALGLSTPYIPITPSSSCLLIDVASGLFANSVPLIELLGLYQGVAWDSINIRMSLSDPRGMCGGMVVGYFPFCNWGGDEQSFNEIAPNMILLNSMMQQWLMNMSPESQLMSFSEGADVSFDIPWQFITPWISADQLQQVNWTVDTAMPIVGSPILWYNLLTASYVNTIPTTAQLRIFATFKGLRLLGPYLLTADIESKVIALRKKLENQTARGSPSSGYIGVSSSYKSGSLAEAARLESWTLQSGLEVGAVALGAVVVDAAIGMGAEILADTVVGEQHNDLTCEVSQGTYEQPDTVQMAYVGDSSVMGPPPTQPMFVRRYGAAKKHRVIDFLMKDQYIGLVVCNGSNNRFVCNPVFPRIYTVGANQPCTWFRWFAQANNYWRGGMVYTFVILGHPLVSIAYTLCIGYSPDNPGTIPVMSGSSTLQGIASGTHTIEVPVPFLSLFDHVPVLDNLASNIVNAVNSNTPAVINATFSVVSTTLDATPNISVAVFCRASEDFMFMQPYAVGLNNPDNDSLLSEGATPHPKKQYRNVPMKQPEEPVPRGPPKAKSLRSQVSKTILQIGLPKVDAMMETRARIVEPTNTMLEMENVETYMQIWSRSLPFEEYVEDEPVPDFTIGCMSPSWWPMDNAAASYTLNTQNSWYCTNDYVSLYSSMFLYYRGSIACKICIVPTDTAAYKYVTLREPGYAVYCPVQYRQETHSPFTYVSNQLPADSNFGNGTVCTPVTLQPVLDVTIPFRCPTYFGLCSPQQFTQTWFGDSTMSGGIWWYNMGWVDHNIVLQDSGGNLSDALFRKVGDDFQLAVQSLPPPPTLWIAKGSVWS